MSVLPLDLAPALQILILLSQFVVCLCYDESSTCVINCDEPCVAYRVWLKTYARFGQWLDEKHNSLINVMKNVVLAFLIANFQRIRNKYSH